MINGSKERADCTFEWELPPANAFFDDDERIRRFIRLPVLDILGAYVVEFERVLEEPDDVTGDGAEL